MIPVDDDTTPREPKTNPYLIPVHAGQTGAVYNPIRLVDAALELSNAAYAICATVFKAGYAYPRQDIVERHARVETTEEGIEVTFPPPGPHEGDTVIVLDHEYRCVEVPMDDSLAQGHVYFDLDTGEWVAFTRYAGQAHMTDTYDSLAKKYPLPEEETNA